MEDNYLQSVIQELDGITKTLSDFKELKSQLTSDIEEVKSTLEQCKELLEDFKKTSSNISDASDVLKTYSERIENVNNSFQREVSDAKEIENRLMLQKMDLLISKAENLNSLNNKEQKNKLNKQKDSLN